MKLAGAVLYVDAVEPVLDFYARAFGLEPNHTDMDVDLPGRQAGERYEFATIATESGELHFATHPLGALMMPGYSRPESGRPSGVEVAFYVDDVDSAFARAVEAGAEVMAQPHDLPWGMRAAYLRSLEGTCIGLSSHPPTDG